MKSSPAFKILSVVVLAAVVLYFGVQIYQYAANPFSTTLTYVTTADDSIPLTGWIVRREETFHTDAATLRHTLGEGQKVGVGQTIAMTYQDASALETVAEMDQLQLQLQQLEFALTSFLDADAALKLDSSITGSILSLHQTLSAGDYSAVADDVSALKAAVLKSSHSYTSVEEIQAEIDSVQSRLWSLEDELRGAQAVTAPRTGTYSSVCDGYESVLTPEFLEGLMPSALKNVSAGDLLCRPGASGAAGGAAAGQGPAGGRDGAGGVRQRAGGRAGGGGLFLRGLSGPGDAAAPPGGGGDLAQLRGAAGAHHVAAAG